VLETDTLAESRLYLLLRIGLGVLFLAASWDKIRHPAAFAEVIQNYMLLPEGMVHPAAILLPWVEAVCGVLLIAGRLCLGSVVIVDGLMVVFTAALTINLIRGVDMSCGCFSVSTEGRQGTYAWYLVRDLAILAAGVWVLIYEIRKEMMDDRSFSA
jgi:uncharacterized membrane protein YphA (DoxX/SURF4 family)